MSKHLWQIILLALWLDVSAGGAFSDKFKHDREPLPSGVHQRSEGANNVVPGDEVNTNRQLRQVKSNGCGYGCNGKSTHLQLLNDEESEDERLSDLDMGHRLEDELKMSSSEKINHAMDDHENLDRRKQVGEPVLKGNSNGLVHYKPPETHHDDDQQTTRMTKYHRLKPKGKDTLQTFQSVDYLQVSDQPKSECSQEVEDDDSVVRAAVLLPNNTDYIMSLTRVLPVLKLAQQEVNRRQLLPGNLSFQFLPRDDHCDAVYAQISTFEAVKKNVHVFLGPACEYSVAPVARMIKFWGTPLLTTGALTFDFSRDKRAPDSEYHLLLRAGLLSFRDMALFLIAIMQQYEWGRVMLVYEKDGCRNISGKHTCKLMMETLVEFFKRRGLHYGSYDLEKNAGDSLVVNLRRELGYLYNSYQHVDTSSVDSVR